MSVRELIVLGTASQAPTRDRNHHGALLRFDDAGILLDPGEGTQRQLLFAGVSASSITRICITHFHGDHCFGLPGILQRMGLDQVDHPVDVHFPAADHAVFAALLALGGGNTRVDVRPRPTDPQTPFDVGSLRIDARPLQHRVEALGWRFSEPDGRRMLPERLAAAGIGGPDIGRLQREGVLDVAGQRVTLEEVSEHRPGQSVAFVMDTALCEAAFELAAGVDLLVIESTFLERDADLARRYRHLTARQAGRIAAEAGARRLVLTHYSQRYRDEQLFADEAREVFDDVVAARDLDRIPLPPRR